MVEPRDQLIPANERVTFQVKVAGEGEPLVFLHGAGGLMWDPFLNALSDRYTVYAPAMPGTGTSSGLESIRDLWDLCLAYYDLFDRLALDAPTVVGHSLGGMIAAELAAIDQSRVGRLVLIAPAGLWRDDQPIPDMFALLPHELLDLVIADPDSPLAQQLKTPPADIEGQMEAMITRSQNMQAAAKFLWPIPDRGLRKRLYRIKAPALVVWGRQDRLIPAIYADDFRHGIANVQVALIDNASHLVTLEQTQQVLQAVTAFLGTRSPVAVA